MERVREGEEVERRREGSCGLKRCGPGAGDPDAEGTCLGGSGQEGTTRRVIALAVQRSRSESENAAG